MLKADGANAIRPYGREYWLKAFDRDDEEGAEEVEDERSFESRCILPWFTTWT